ncbi:glycosyltransferase [Rudaeicoccus suwonensis]|uniref:UDP:flavonoid glycosyltransferase YjiC (YdhE family) n=1 Tax=Rudaeicoccus suwonensis TaxID=657409 RepID=A0A561DX93_9MICO|nr:nucleotide disphospho-sugar-binding domain-containing protein [Rudaeicoccus suwonensis]TWE07952.1 UDP:flavonoid glycosyltransferase YjiC (YdhE family) [Rudaeicoccus suwonensis]
MQILMPFLGSRGDVSPGVALAIELQRRDHDVVLGVPANLLQLARDSGVDAVEMGPDSRELLRSDLVQRRIKSANPVRKWRALSELGCFGWGELAPQLARYAATTDVIVSCLLGEEVARAIAERYAVAQVALHYYPIRRSESTSVVPPAPVAPRLLQHVADAALERSWRLMTRSGEDAVRSSLHLPPSRTPLPARMIGSGSLEIQAVDPLLFPGLAEEWGSRRPLVGFLDLDDATHERVDRPTATHDTGLGSWLSDGKPCVYWGFGSMPVKDPRATVALIREVSTHLGVRALVAAGWSDLADATEADVRIVDAVDHRTVFPRCAAAVHHGGAGTTAATLRAGIPSFVAWFSADQPLWGRRLAACGVGASAPFRTLTAAKAIEILRPLLQPASRARAAEVAESLIPAERAVAATADLVELAGARHSSTSQGAIFATP